ncbi:hypothetical protein ALC56_13773 [Trachymyrmex septentrionalis]|uniref:Uncharacterized protein n=1 Tax=Trachymyrmex septentrionalis TaxID=34720 RepID=A0A195EUT3_9HYME|nr:hypothetical protein ALC56_13773 [Trachymyrmex septentrionalis]
MSVAFFAFAAMEKISRLLLRAWRIFRAEPSVAVRNGRSAAAPETAETMRLNFHSGRNTEQAHEGIYRKVVIVTSVVLSRPFGCGLSFLAASETRLSFSLTLTEYCFLEQDFLRVTGIVGRADVLACIFFLLSFLAYHG